MNFYIFSQDPSLAATYQADNHINYGIKAATQALVNVHKLITEDERFQGWEVVYNGQHFYSPEVAAWCMVNKAHYKWMLNFLHQLHLEHEGRGCENNPEHHWKPMLRRLAVPPTELLNSETIMNLPNEGTSTLAETVEKWRRYACENHTEFVYHRRISPQWFHPHIIE